MESPQAKALGLCVEIFASIPIGVARRFNLPLALSPGPNHKYLWLISSTHNESD